MLGRVKKERKNNFETNSTNYEDSLFFSRIRERRE